VNLCKLADITHRINRAEEHDSQQVAHWIAHEVSRRDENASSLTRREERLQFLRGEDSGQLLEQSVGKLKSQINVLNDRLALAVGEEDEARKVRTHAFYFFLFAPLLVRESPSVHRPARH
jgi:hypothetical protein